MAKRMMLEWGVIFSFGIFLALSTLWVGSRFLDKSSHHLRISTTGNLNHDLHLLVHDGKLSLSSDFEVNPSGGVRPLIVDGKRPLKKDILRGDRHWRFTIPGLDLRSYWNAPSRFLIWSMEQTLLIPVGLSFLLTAWLRFRLRRLSATTSSRDGSAVAING